MSAHLDKLMMQVALIDQVTKPLKGIQNAVTQTADAGRSGWENMAGGGAGVVASGLAIHQALMPAIEMDRALGELKSLGVVDEDLDAVAQTAFEFSSEFGQSAVEVVRHAEGIKNAMGEMPGDVLANVTRTSAVLTTAMKSDAETVNRYLKNLYGNYQSQADAMGKDSWAQQVAGMTATAKQLFGVEMSAIESMVDGMHSLPSTMGVSLQEQLAVLGSLQGQMSEGDAVTQYTNFLENAVAAQDKLGVKLTDSHGQLLPMQQVLKNIAPLLDGLSGTQARTLLDEAGLGDGALMLTNLVNRSDEFAKNMDALNNVTGMDAATTMASTMTDQWQRLEASWYSVRAAAFGLVLPSINAIVGLMADGFHTLLGWSQEFPTLTQYLAYAALAIVGSAAVISVWNMMVGLASFIGAGWSSVILLLTTVMKGFNLVMKMARFAALGFAMAAVFAQMPLLPLILGIGAVVAAVAAVIYFWDDLKAAWSDFSFIESLGSMVDWLIEKINLIPGINIGGETGDIPAIKGAEVPAINEYQAAVPEVGHELVRMHQQNVTMPPVLDTEKSKEVASPISTYIGGSAENKANVSQQLKQMSSSTTDNSRTQHVGDVYITQEKAFTPSELSAWNEMSTP